MIRTLSQAQLEELENMFHELYSYDVILATQESNTVVLTGYDSEPPGVSRDPRFGPTYDSQVLGIIKLW